MREQVERRAAEQRDRGHERQRIADVGERLLQPEREQHDPGDHREVQVGVGVARDLVALAALGGLRQAPRRRRARRRRSTSHHSAAATTMPSTAATTTPASTLGLGADADRDDRLAQRDDHDQAVALGEVPRHELPARRRRRAAGRPCRAAARAPQSAPCSAAVGERGARAAARRRSPCSTASPITDLRSAGSSRLASMNSTMCAVRTTP